MAEKMVLEKVEEHKQKEIVKQRELESLHNRAVSALEDAKQEKHHLREENKRLKQELRAVKIQLSNNLVVARAATPWERLAALGTRSDFCGFPCLCVENYQSTDRRWHH